MPFILLIAYGNMQMFIAAIHKVCDGFVKKSFNLEQLHNEIVRVINR